MNRRLLALIMALALCLGGCRLAREGEGMGQEQGDRLVGALVTTELLAVTEPEDRFQGREEQRETGEDAEMKGEALGRLWAQASQIEKSGGTVTRYDFPQVKGYLCMLETVRDTADGADVISSRVDPPLTPTGMRMNVSDGGTSYDLSARLYMASGGSGHAMYVNPVYLTADGRAYALAQNSGFSASQSDSLGDVLTQSFSDVMTTTTSGRRSSEAMSVSITLTIKNAPRKMTVIEMSASNQILRQREYGPDTLPDSIRPLEHCAYLLVEMVSTQLNGAEERERVIYEKGNAYLPFYVEEQNGVLTQTQVPIYWA